MISRAPINFDLQGPGTRLTERYVDLLRTAFDGAKSQAAVLGDLARIESVPRPTRMRASSFSLLETELAGTLRQMLNSIAWPSGRGSPESMRTASIKAAAGYQGQDRPAELLGVLGRLHNQNVERLLSLLSSASHLGRPDDCAALRRCLRDERDLCAWLLEVLREQGASSRAALSLWTAAEGRCSRRGPGSDAQSGRIRVHRRPGRWARFESERDVED